MALRAGVRSGADLDRMYGEGLSTALAVHLLREYGAAVLGLKRQYGGLTREKLVRAVEYIQDQLDTDLTVSGIAQAVGMSPYYFTRLFKESTAGKKWIVGGFPFVLRAAFYPKNCTKLQENHNLFNECLPDLWRPIQKLPRTQGQGFNPRISPSGYA